MSIRWPKEWAHDKGWPGVQAGPALRSGRTWSAINQRLHLCQDSLPNRCQSLGAPGPFTFEWIKAKVLEYRRMFGQWPRTKKGSSRRRQKDPLIPGDRRRWSAANVWLRKNQGVNLRELCQTLGEEEPPPAFCLESVKAKLLLAKAQKGTWPRLTDLIPNESRRWDAADQWLKKHENSSLARLKRDLGHDPPRPFTISLLESRIRQHKRTTGRWPASSQDPMPGDTRTWNTADAWLRRRGLTLATLVARVGRPVLRPFTMKRIEQEVRLFTRAHGSWPTCDSQEKLANDPRGWAAVDRWLHTKGTSLSELTIRLGKPRRYRKDAYQYRHHKVAA